MGVWLLAAPASAHRLDEYLQATRLAVDVDRLGVEIDLTAGQSLAAVLFASIDTDRDGSISPAEGAAYAQQVLRAVTLSIDDRPARLVLVQAGYPTLAQMRDGVGTIRLHASSERSESKGGRHHVAYFNGYRPEASVYLANALVPDDPKIQLGRPQRDPLQRGLALDYQIGGTWGPALAGPSGWWSLAGLAMVAMLVLARRTTS